MCDNSFVEDIYIYIFYKTVVAHNNFYIYISLVECENVIFSAHAGLCYFHGARNCRANYFTLNCCRKRVL